MKDFLPFYPLPIGITPTEAALSDEKATANLIKMNHVINCQDFEKLILSLPAEAIKEKLEVYLFTYRRNGGDALEWINETKKHLHRQLTAEQKHAILSTLEDLEGKYSNDGRIRMSGGEDYLESALLGRLIEIETAIGDKFKSWTLIKRAAFIELLMEKGYFLPDYKEKNRRRNCIYFAKARYNTNIRNQMLVKEDENRAKHKKQLQHYLK